MLIERPHSHFCAAVSDDFFETQSFRTQMFFLNIFFQSIYKILKCTITLDLSGPGSNVSKGVHHTPLDLHNWSLPIGAVLRHTEDAGNKLKLATVVEVDPKAPFSIATTPSCRGGYYSFSVKCSTLPLIPTL